MKQVILLAIVLAVLTGCASTSDRPVAESRIAERVEYFVRIPPDELLTLPTEPAKIDVDKTTQADVARWLLANEDYIKALKAKFSGVAKFLKNEQDKLDSEARTKNSIAGTASTANMIATLPALKPLAPLAPLSAASSVPTK